MVTLVAAVATLVLAVVLVTASRIDTLRGTPRSRWLSFSGGVAVTYVFLKLLPELTRAVHEDSAHSGSSGWFREHRLFLVALAGAAILYAIERAAKRTKDRRSERGKEERSAAWVFWLHLVVLAVYVAFIGYLLFREGEQKLASVAVLGTVMALHFAGIAVALADDYRSLYTTAGRWILAAAVVGGAVFGYLRHLPDFAFHMVLGVLAGAVIFNAIKEEIPPDKESRFWALGVGVLVAGGLLYLAG